MPGRSRLAPWLAVLVAVGCRGDSAEVPVDAPPPASTSSLQADTAQRIRVLGSGAAFVFVVDPGEDAWARTREQILAVGTRAGIELASEDRDTPVRDALRAFGISIDDFEIPQGWDRGRRTVIALGDPIVSGPPGSTALTLMDPVQVRLRHVVVLPATDVERLVASLDRMLEAAGEPWPALVAGTPGARARVLRGQGAVALLPGADAVRIVAITHALREPEAALSAFIADLEPSPGEVEDTPAVELVARPELDAAVYVRPWRLRVLASMLAMHAAHGALPEIEPAFRRSALLAGLNIVLGCERMLGEPRELEDWGIGFVADGPASSATTIATLTEHGRRLASTVATDAAPLGLHRDDLAASTFLGVTVAPDEPRATTRDREAMQACGRLAPWIAGTSSPMAWGSRMAQSVAGDGLGEELGAALDARPQGLQLAVLPTASGGGSALATIHVRREAAARLAQTLEQRGARVTVTTRNAEHVVLAGFGVDPREVFAPDVAAERRGLLDVEIRQPGRPFVRGRLQVLDGVVLGEVSGPSQPLRPFTVPAAARAARRSPLGEADHDALECLRRAQAIVVPVLERLNDPRARHTTRGAMEWLSLAKTDSECALAHADTREAMAALLDHTRREAAATLARIGEVKAATEVLGSVCEQPSEECLAWSRLRTLPRVSLPRVEHAASCVEKTFSEPIGIPVLVADGRIAIAGEPVPAEREALVAAFERVRPPAPESMKVDLLVGPWVPLDTVAPVLQALVSMGIDMVYVGAMSEAHGFVGTGLQLRPSRRSSLPPEMSWQELVWRLEEHCELARIGI